MKTFIVLISILVTSSASALMTPSRESLSTSCHISNQVSRAINQYFQEEQRYNQDELKFQRSLIQARREFGDHIEKVLNDPANANLLNELRTFNNRVSSKINSETSENDLSVHIIEAIVPTMDLESKDIFDRLSEKLSFSEEMPPKYGSMGPNEKKTMKLRKLRRNSSKHNSLLYQQNRFHLPLAFEQFVDDKSIGFQYWFEIGLEFKQDGSIKVVDMGESTGIGMKGQCDTYSRKFHSNEYFVNYSKSKNMICDDSVNMGNSVLLREDDIHRNDLAVNYQSKDESLSPQNVSLACGTEEDYLSRFETYHNQELARRPRGETNFRNDAESPFRYYRRSIHVN
jgi:hypothetical protein